MFEAEAGLKIDGETGRIQRDNPFYMATGELYRARANDRIVVRDWAFLLGVATYGEDIPEEYMYTYMYEPEQNWGRYQGDFSGQSFSREDYVFQRDCWFRLCLRKEDGNWCVPSDAERINEILEFHSDSSRIPGEGEEEETCFYGEIQKTADTVLSYTAEGKSLVFGLLSDSHYTVNGTWEQTVRNLKKVHDRVGFDGLIHLGDLQDGLLDRKMCRRIATRCIRDMQEVCQPVYLAIGNHDTNYFRGNPDWLGEEEQYGIYGRFMEQYVIREGTKGWYYVDYDRGGVRMLFLSSFDHREEHRYGFPKEETEWVKRILEATPEGYQVLVFSHDAPLARLDYWAKEIRNGERLMEILEAYHNLPGKRILGYLHGHTHADYVYRERSFPIISIGCSKCEYFPDKKPEGSIRQMRRLKEVSQELWDVLVVQPDKKTLKLVRFGAGEDRVIRPATKVWAHRGASGYAPENTLEAFRLAAEMGADGVELDVQLTRDGELAVIHDEWIDRVSDGSGRVADYTLEQLKDFNFNKTHPEYAEVCRIPTLREALECLRDTGLAVNIELKTGIDFYEGIEKKTVELVRELGYQNRVIYSSFNHKSVLKVREWEPAARLGFLYSHQLADAAGYARIHNVGAVHPGLSWTYYEEEVKECIRENIDVNVWTVNDEGEMRRLAGLGVNAIITNYPDVARRVVDGEGNGL